MEKHEELLQWKEHLKALTPTILEQIEWLRVGEVRASVNPECPEKLLAVAKRLVELQNQVGEYQRNQIPKEDVERIKYFSKTLKIGFDDVVKLAVSNSRYVSKDVVEARGVVGYILEIQSVYENIYKRHGVFPINAMDAEVKRACRNFKTDVSIKDKIEAIVEVFLPELKGMEIVENDYSISPQTKYELSSEEIERLIAYFKAHAKDGKVDSCFELENQKEFMEVCKLLAKANMTPDEFLRKWTDLTYSKCYSIDIIPATKQMVSAYRERFGTTQKITDYDPYLRSKIEAAERMLGKYTIKDLLTYLKVQNDNFGDGRNPLSKEDLMARESYLIKKLKQLYPSGVIGKDFIRTYPAIYEELKLLASRMGGGSIDSYLSGFGLSRESFHEQHSESVFYLSERDLDYYGFREMAPADFDDCNISELNPRDYFGVYNRLIVLNQDGLGISQKQAKNLGE